MQKIHTYPKMNETIKDLLRDWDDNLHQYILARIEELEKLAAGAEPVRHGRWVYNDICSDEYTDVYTCDQCGHEIVLNVELYTEPNPKYCPECGAKMDGGDPT